MNRSNSQQIRYWLLTGLLVGSSLSFYNCSNGKKESESSAQESSTADSSFMGRQGDTTFSDVNAPQQAPPDSADRGAVVPAEVKVKAKKE